MNTMKAATRSGGNILFNTNYAVPSIGANNVLVRVKAAAINPIDYKLPWPLAGRVVGIDFAGIVEEKGQQVTSFNKGDEVFGRTTSGSLAELATADPKTIALKPTTASFAEAAAMHVTYVSSLQSLRAGNLRKGGRLLIIGASGGCGVAAIQLAKSMGAKDIVGVCSGKNADFIKGLGATHVIDYTKETIKEFCLGERNSGEVDDEMKFDVIYDAATNSGGGEDYKAVSLELLRPETADRKHGQYVAVNGSLGMWARKFTKFGQAANEHLILCDTNRKDLEHLAHLVDEGWEDGNGNIEKLKPELSEVLPFTEENLSKGFDLLKTRRVRGKIVFEME